MRKHLLELFIGVLVVMWVSSVLGWTNKGGGHYSGTCSEAKPTGVNGDIYNCSDDPNIGRTFTKGTTTWTEQSAATISGMNFSAITGSATNAQLPSSITVSSVSATSINSKGGSIVINNNVSLSPSLIVTESSTTTFEMRNAPYNLYLGNNSGTQTTTGLYNTGVGISALGNTKGAYRNTAMGYNSMSSLNATGNDNTAQGYYALGINNGAYNTAQGSTALGSNTGSENTAQGYAALTNNAGASYNTAVGYNALTGNSSGQYNVGIGASALSTSNTDANVAVGYNALTSSSYAGAIAGNTAVGHTSGDSISTGRFNTFLGYESGKNASQKLDAYNSTAIGFRAYTTADYQVAIGNDEVTSTVLKGIVSAGTGLTTSGTGTFANIVSSGTGSFSGILTANGGLYSVGTLTAYHNLYVYDKAGFGITPVHALQVKNSTPNTWAGFFENQSADGQNYGLTSIGGTNSSDMAFRVASSGTVTTYFTIRGDGLTTINAPFVTNQTGSFGGTLTANAGIQSNGTVTVNNVQPNSYSVNSSHTIGMIPANDTLGTVRARLNLSAQGNTSVDASDAWRWSLATIAASGSSNFNSSLAILRTTRAGVTDSADLTVNKNGNVGIGTTTPTALSRLTVSGGDIDVIAGGISTAGTVTTNNVAISNGTAVLSSLTISAQTGIRLQGGGGSGYSHIISAGANETVTMNNLATLSFNNGTQFLSNIPNNYALTLKTGLTPTPVMVWYENGITDAKYGITTAGTVSAPNLSLTSYTTNTFGGGLLATIGTCTSGTATVSGATTNMVAISNPIDGVSEDLIIVRTWVSAADTVTVKECALAAVTPAARRYSIRLIQ